MRATFTAIESEDTSDHPELAALYDVDGNLFVEGEAYGDAVRNDYGVPGSPVWYEIEDITIEEFIINGVSCTFKELVGAHGKDVAETLNSICVDRVEEFGDWS